MTYNGPIVLIGKSGSLSFNLIAQKQYGLRSLERVNIGYDKDKNELVLLPCDKSCFGSRKFSHQELNLSTRTKANPVTFLAGKGFLRYFGIDFSVGRYYRVSKVGDNIIIDLNSIGERTPGMDK